MRVVNSLEKHGLLIKAVSGIIKNEAKKQKEGFLRMLLDTLEASVLGNLLTSKGTHRTDQDF